MIRTLDLLFTGITLILLLPLFIPIMIILKFTGEGEIFYRQERVGKNGIKFKLLKFATMLKDSPNIGAGEITITNDSRILPVGKFLRKSKINELPQLINILVGNMSLVGPRPMVPNTFEKYPQDHKKIILLVKPGLTGVGSIYFRDEEKFLNSKNPKHVYDNLIIPYKSKLECWFVENRSLYLYLKIILITAWVVLFPDNKYYHRFFNKLPIPPMKLNL